MKFTAQTSIKKPTILIIGSFEPLLREHIAVAETLVARCTGLELDPGVIIIDPLPWDILHPESPSPKHCDLSTKIKSFKNIGIKTVLSCRFDQESLSIDAFKFLNFLRKTLPLAGLWLGANQSLGPGPRGSGRAVAEFAALAQIELKVIGHDNYLKLKSQQIREKLSLGDIEGAKEISGFYPEFRFVPGSQPPRLHWHPGIYQAIPEDGGEPLPLMVASDGSAVFLESDVDTKHFKIMKSENFFK